MGGLRVIAALALVLQDLARAVVFTRSKPALDLFLAKRSNATQAEGRGSGEATMKTMSCIPCPEEGVWVKPTIGEAIEYKPMVAKLHQSSHNAHSHQELDASRHTT